MNKMRILTGNSNGIMIEGGIKMKKINFSFNSFTEEVLDNIIKIEAMGITVINENGATIELSKITPNRTSTEPAISTASILRITTDEMFNMSIAGSFFKLDKQEVDNLKKCLVDSGLVEVVPSSTLIRIITLENDDKFEWAFAVCSDAINKVTFNSSKCNWINLRIEDVRKYTILYKKRLELVNSNPIDPEEKATKYSEITNIVREMKMLHLEIRGKQYRNTNIL